MSVCCSNRVSVCSTASRTSADRSWAAGSSWSDRRSTRAKSSSPFTSVLSDSALRTMRVRRSARRSASSDSSRSRRRLLNPTMAATGVRSSCDTVLRNSVFRWSSSRSWRALASSRSKAWAFEMAEPVSSATAAVVRSSASSMCRFGITATAPTARPPRSSGITASAPAASSVGARRSSATCRGTATARRPIANTSTSAPRSSATRIDVPARSSSSVSSTASAGRTSARSRLRWSSAPASPTRPSCRTRSSASAAFAATTCRARREATITPAPSASATATMARAGVRLGFATAASTVHCRPAMSTSTVTVPLPSLWGAPGLSVTSSVWRSSWPTTKPSMDARRSATVLAASPLR